MFGVKRMIFEELREDIVFGIGVGFSVVIVLVFEQLEYDFVAGVRGIFSAFVDVARRHDEDAKFAQVGCQVEHHAIHGKDDDFVGDRVVGSWRGLELVGVFHHQAESLFDGQVDGCVALVAAHLYGAFEVKLEDVHGWGALYV